MGTRKRKKKYPGQGMHIEYHTVNPKRDKAADCIYLTSDRICQHKESNVYLSKCFVAQDCPYRLRQKEADEIAKQKEIQKRIQQRKQAIKSQPKPPPAIKYIKCTIPHYSYFFNKTYGKGTFVEYDESTRLLSLNFKGEIKQFKYPEAILQKYIILPKFAFKYVLDDLSKAVKEG